MKKKIKTDVDALIFLRKFSGLSQESLAKKSGVGLAAIKRAETEKVATRSSTFKKLFEEIHKEKMKREKLYKESILILKKHLSGSEIENFVQNSIKDFKKEINKK